MEDMLELEARQHVVAVNAAAKRLRNMPPPPPPPPSQLPVDGRVAAYLALFRARTAADQRRAQTVLFPVPPTTLVAATTPLAPTPAFLSDLLADIAALDADA